MKKLLERVQCKLIGYISLSEGFIMVKLTTWKDYTYNIVDMNFIYVETFCTKYTLIDMVFFFDFESLI